MATLCLAMFANAGEVIMYYTAPQSVIGTYTVKVNVKLQGSEVSDGDAQWTTSEMTKTELTYNSDPVYQGKFTTPYGGFSTLQIQLWDGSEWKSQKEAYNGSAWNSDAAINGKMYVHSTSSWVAAPEGAELPQLTYYIKNNWNGVTDWTWKAMTKVDDDTWTYEDIFGGSGCNINTSESDGDAKWFAVADITVTDGSLIAGAKALFTYKVAANTLAAKITEAADVQPIGSGDLYVLGDVEGYGWNPSKAPKMTLADGKYSLTAKLVSSNSEYAFFSFTTALSADAGDWTSIAANRYGAELDGTEITAGKSAALTNGELAFKALQGYTYTITVDPTKMEVALTSEEDITPITPTTDYYLVGYINGADLGCNDDWENLGTYKFVDGKVTVTFTSGDADFGKNYVFVKTGDNKKWYMAATYSEASPVTLALSENGVEGTPSEKVGIAELGTYNFTLTENTDGTLTLAFEKEGGSGNGGGGNSGDVDTEIKNNFYLIGEWGGNVYGDGDDYANFIEENRFVDCKIQKTFADENSTCWVRVKRKQADGGWMFYSTDDWQGDGNQSITLYSADYLYKAGKDATSNRWSLPTNTKHNIIMIVKSIDEVELRLVDDAAYAAHNCGNEVNAVENISAMELRIENGTIIAEGELHIFNLMGQEVTGQNGNLSGLYIVTLNGKAAKVAVK